MNELLNNFMNQIEDVNRVKEMSVEEFAKLVRGNKLITEEDAKQLIVSFKKISDKKSADDEDNDSDQRKKKYIQQQKVENINFANKNEKVNNEKENNDSKER